MRKMRQDFSRSMRLIAIVGPLSALLAACGGGGGGGGGGNLPPPGSTVVVSGKITFDRVPFKTTPGTGLNPDAPVESPARQVVVEAISASNSVLASTTTDTAGDFSLTVPASTSIFLRAKAQMLKTGTAPTWNFSVRNNTNSDALYVLDGSSFDTGTANSTRNLRAASGWNGTTFDDDQRTAAPFAILDTVFRAKELILTASVTTAFPALDLFWSSDNRSTANGLCPDNGDIGTSFFVTSGFSDECQPSNALPSGIYILGDFAGGNGDTDEFDAHVIAHEFGHYLEDSFSRSDSTGGDHTGGDRLDLRLAFGEGWGNAYSAMSLNDPEYRDSFVGISEDFGFNLENGPDPTPGWFSELSVQRVLWDFFDSTADTADTLNLGFPPLWDVMLNAHRTTDALTSVFTFASGLKAANSGITADVNTRLSSSGITGTGPFGEGENNFGAVADMQPIYLPVNPGTTQVCTNTTAGTFNKLGNRRLLSLTLAQPATVNISVTGLAGSQATPPPDPEVHLWTQGSVVISEEFGMQETLQRQLSAGTHIIEVFECTHVTDPEVCHPNLTNPPVRDRTCMSVAIQVN